MLILGLESSCDETAAAVVQDGRVILSNEVASQMEIHSRFGGVVPEIACRAHEEALLPIIQKALHSAEKKITDMDAIAVTYGPGLVGALMVGVSAAKAMAMVSKIPLITVNHIEAHVYANFLHTAAGSSPLNDAEPFVALIVSGGHTLLVYVRSWGNYEVLGQTQDDAVGEAYDKVARLMGLGYPGGPVIDRLAKEGNPKAIPLPKGQVRDNPYAFSFSGLKTAVLYYLQKNPDVAVADVAASFQQAVVDVLLEKTFAAARAKNVQQIAVGGGVSLNRSLRERFAQEAAVLGMKVAFPGPGLSVDNAAMIAGLAYPLYRKGCYAGWDVDVDPCLPFRNWA